MRTITVATALTAALLLTTSCTVNVPAAAPSSSPAPSHSYDVHDCKAVLERVYEADDPYNASGDPECEHLTQAANFFRGTARPGPQPRHPPRPHEP